MKFTKHILASAVVLATSSFAIAATDSTDITIQVTEDPVVTLEGTLNNNPTPTLSLADVTSAATVLGTLGLASNVTGTCAIAVTSGNGNFMLEHDVTAGVTLHGAGTYNVDIMGTNYGTANGAGTANCTTAPVAVTLNTPALALPVAAGTYQDILTVTVTTP